MLPEYAAVEPTTAWDAIANPPSLIADQFAPNPPFPRLKSSETIPVALPVHETEALVTFVAVIVPVPLATVQVWPAGFVLTVTT